MEVASPELMDKIHFVVLTNWRLKAREIVVAIGISRLSGFDFKRTLAYVVTICKMGTSLVTIHDKCNHELQRNVWCCSTDIQTSFCAVS